MGAVVVEVVTEFAVFFLAGVLRLGARLAAGAFVVVGVVVITVGVVVTTVGVVVIAVGVVVITVGVVTGLPAVTGGTLDNVVETTAGVMLFKLTLLSLAGPFELTTFGTRLA